MNDEALFEQVLSGNQPALEELVARYYEPLRTYLYRLMDGNEQDAEDLVQETFVRMLRYRGKCPQNFRFWIYKVGRNLAYDRFRSANYKYEQVGVDAELMEACDETSLPYHSMSIDPAPEMQVLTQISAEAVRAELHQLPVLQREVILLRFYGDMKLEEIAEITGCPLGTVKSRLFNGLKRYKRILAEVEHDHA